MISLLASSSVNLMPDKTVLFQLGTFLFVVGVLHHLVFKPVLRIIDRRRALTEEMEISARHLLSNAEMMEREYEEKMAAARTEGQELEQRLNREGDEKGKRIVSDARREADKKLEAVRTKVSTESTATKQALSQRVGEFTNMIVSKVLGKGVI